MARAGLASLLQRVGRLVRGRGDSHGTSVIGPAAGFEPLEPRQLLATIVWDGGPSGTGTNFLDPANWVGDVVPGVLDDAVINTPGPTITLAGLRTVLSLTSSRGLQINFGGELAVRSDSSMTAPLTLSGGAMSGRAWNFSGAGSRVNATSSGGILRNATINGEVLMAGGATATVVGATVVSAVRLTGENSSLTLNAGSLLRGVVQAEGEALGTRRVSVATTNAGTATLGSESVLRLAAGCGGNLEVSMGTDSTLVNNGMISAEAAERTLSIRFGSFNNIGAVRAVAGTASLGGLVRNSGVFIGITGNLDITGTLIATGTTQTLNAATGSWNVRGGRISGGTFNFMDGAHLRPTPEGGILLDVTVNGDWILTGTGGVALSGSTSFGTIRLRGNVGVGLAAGYTLNGAIVAEGSEPGVRRVSLGTSGGGGGPTIGPPGSIRLTPGTGGQLSIDQDTGGTLVNNGLISIDAVGHTSTMQMSSFVNAGVLRISAGTLEMHASMSWTNTGTFAMSGGTLQLLGTLQAMEGIGAWERTGGVFNVSGTINNVNGGLTLDGSTGSWTMRGGMITDGTLTFADGARLIFTSAGARLRNVVINGDILLADTNGSVRLEGSTTFGTARLQAGGTALRLLPGYVVRSPIVAEGRSITQRTIVLADGGPGTNTIGPSGSIRLLTGTGGGLTIFNSSTATLVNNGLISAEADGQTLSVGPNTFTNAGTLQVAAGTLEVRPSSLTNFFDGTLIGGAWRAMGGRLSTFVGNITSLATGTTVELGASGTWTAANSIATNNGTLRLTGGRGFVAASGFTNNGTLELSAGSLFSVTGAFTQGAAGTLAVQIGGANPATQAGRVVATGAATLGGSLRVSLVNGFSPRQGSFQLVQAASVSGTFASATLGNGGLGTAKKRNAQLVYSPTGVSLVFDVPTAVAGPLATA